jgi:periplasmic binding family protein
MHAIRRTLTLAVAATAFAAVASGMALADPPSGTVPAATDIVGLSCPPLFVGSPTENTAGSLVGDYDATNPASKLYCWDDVNPGTGQPGDTIVTKGSGSSDKSCSMTRPDGTDAEVAALENSRLDNGDPCVDFVFSERAPQSGDPSTIAFVALAGDAVAWSSPAGTSSDPSPVPSTLTFTQLQAIYTCTDTNWDQVGGIDAPIVPVLPRQGSGTRDTFLLALGGGTTPLVPGSCVVDGTSTGIEENTGLSAGNEAQFGPNGVPAVDDVFPYSIGDYIAQGPASNGVGGHASTVWGHGDLVLHAMTDDNGVVQQPITANSSDQPVINRAFPSEMQRTLYDVMRGPGIPGNLQPIFGPTGWICTNTTAQADILSYGFFNLGRNCGLVPAG